MNKKLALLVSGCMFVGIILTNSCKKEPVIPTLTTTSVTEITVNSATTGGLISKDGGATVTVRGVCWGTTAAPSLSGSHTTDNKGTGSFTSSLTDLTPNTLYHIRAYATNSVGTAYGNEITFTTSQIVTATLTTTDISLISQTTAVSGGNITADGNGAISARGICWATTTAPSVANSLTTDGSGTGIFTSNLTPLLPATKYYVRAYATNSAGTAYGNEVSFTTSSIAVPTLTTTAASAITLTTATSGGNITADGGGAVTARGVCYATTTGPTIASPKTTNGTGTGSFVSNLTGLLPGTTYYVRAYATNSAGTAYGNELSFATSPVVVPTLTTTAATLITLTTATAGGNITADGGGAVTARGTCWSTTLNPTITNSKTTDGTGTGVFTSSLTGLSPNTLYHIRAYATNSGGTAYGNDLTFTTTAVVVPTVTTAAATAITLTTATSGGNVTADGGGAVTARGTCWATILNPTITNSKTTDGTGTGIFTSSLTGLLPGTLYHIRAYATNSAGTAYGNDLTFTTSPVGLATLTTTAVTAIDVTTASSGGNITADGGGAVTARGVCWATTANPTILNTVTTNGTGTGIFTSSITGLLQGTTYYLRAYATNSAGTAYGNQVVFNTQLGDVDGNKYNIVVIGTQIWMAENLKTTKLSDGTEIANITVDATWAADSVAMTPAYCWYNNDMATNKPLYGALYNWYSVNTGALCPTGWHAPTDAEFSTLESFLGMSGAQISLSWAWRGTNEGTQLKSATTWNTGTGTNTSGFSALAGGYRYAIDGSFNNAGDLSYWWSATALDATTSWYRRLDGSQTGVYRAAVNTAAGKYVRCVKN